MQNPIPKFRQDYTIFEKPGYLAKNWKLWRAPAIIKFNFFAEIMYGFAT